MLNWKTFNYGLIGRLSTGRQAGDYLVVGPDWKGQPPKGIAQVFRSGTQFSMVLFRTQLFGPDDIDGVKAVQAAYRVTPLSTWSKTAVPPAPTSVFTKAKDPTLTMETLDQLGSKLQLPADWKFEKLILQEDLSLQPRWSDGYANIMRDNLGNTYMGCGFDKSCSYLP